MKCNVERVIEALIGAELAAGRRISGQAKGQLPRPPLATVSRGYGALGREFAEMFAAQLGVDCCDREILEGIVRRARVDVKLVERIEERVGLGRGEWWRSFITGKRLSEDAYSGYLVKVMHGIALTGGVILGRAANFILAGENPLRVRIVGSRDVCAARIAGREKLSLAAAVLRVAEVDARRADFVRALTGEDIDRPDAYDLIMNSDGLSVEMMVDLAMPAMRQKQAAGARSP